MSSPFRKAVWIVAGIAVVAATVRVGAGMLSRGSGCRAGREPVPNGAPPFPQGPTDAHGVWVINTDGSGEARLQTGQSRDNAAVVAIALSPDATRVAYVETGSYSLNVADLGGQHARELVGNAATPAWSPSGSQVAFMGNGLEVINIDGSGRHTIMPNGPDGQSPHDPAWSPDGKYLAYTSWAGRDVVQVVSTEGGQPNTVAAQHDFRLSHPSWSPDGRRIVFAAGGGYYGTWLGVVRADGGGVRRIASHCSGGNPAWSPDGTRIAYEDSYGLNIINADGSHRLRVPNSWYGHQPTWSPDGKRLYFFRY